MADKSAVKMLQPPMMP